MGNIIQQRLDALRNKMKENGISVYMIPTADYHKSEYVSDYFKERAFMTGFTGSAGTFVITQKEAALWTDGRYFIQAEHQLDGSGIILQKMGMEGVPSILAYIREVLPEGGCLGFDGRVVDAATAEMYSEEAVKKNASICTSMDLVGEIWKDRPEFPCSQAFVLDVKYAGKDTEEKLSDVRRVMKECGADWHVLSSLCDIAWLLNIRGSDISHVPVIMSFLLMSETECRWYVNEKALTDEVNQYVNEKKISIRPYESIYEDLSMLPQDQTIMLQKSSVNTNIINALPDGMTVICRNNPQERMKAVKNETEIRNIRQAHIKDGVAFTKFCFWLKNNIGHTYITELSAAEYLDQLRAQQENFVDISFDTISAYGPNAAMMHYAPSQKQNAVLKPEGFLLVDSGGHYLEGSTDITRNIVLGPLSDQEKRLFTAVVRSNMNLAHARFLYGCQGQNLDILARGPLWQMGLDYRCGTGHGNGYLLNVHEGPNAFRWKITAGSTGDEVLEEGMVTTDEPGVYVEGQFGIRIENELVCRKWKKNEYGQFMEFETITYAPIDLDAVIPEEMTQTERDYLNAYHKMVRETVSPYLTEEEQRWLAEQTREI